MNTDEVARGIAEAQPNKDGVRRVRVLRRGGAMKVTWRPQYMTAKEVSVAIGLAMVLAVRDGGSHVHHAEEVEILSDGPAYTVRFLYNGDVFCAPNVWHRDVREAVQ